MPEPLARQFPTAIAFALRNPARNRFAWMLLAGFIPAWYVLMAALISHDPLAFRLFSTGTMLHVDGRELGLVTAGMNSLTLIVGFGLHNATEGFGICGPLTGEGSRPSWSFLGVMGVIGGGPTFLDHRLHLVALHALEHALDVLALEFLQGHSGALDVHHRGGRSVAQLVGQIVRMDHVGFGQNRRALDRVFKLAHVAGPGIVDHHAQRALGKSHPGPVERLLRLAQEVIRQQRDIVLAFA